MPNGVCPFATYQPGADSHLNASRAQGVPFAVLHRTQGEDSRGLGRTRRHSSPGTFQFLIRAGELYQFYPAHVRCSHAAGGNDGVGIEIEGYDGTPVAAADLAVLGRLAHWLADTYGIPLSFHDGKRRAADDSDFRGFITHASIATEPKWQHHDNITAAEWQAAIGSPTPITKVAAMLVTLDGQSVYIFDPSKPSGQRFRMMENKTLSEANKDKAAIISQATYDWLNAEGQTVVSALRKLFPTRAARLDA